MLFDECPIVSSWSNIPHIDDMYRNISLLGIAVANDDVVMMYKLIKDGCDVNYNGTAIPFYFDEEYQPFVSGQTPLHIAAMEGSTDAVKLLLAYKETDVNAEDGWGIQPVFDAANWGNNEIIELLVQAGADVESTSDHFLMDGATPLKGAAMWGYDDTVQLLIDLGADMDRQTGDWNDTALHAAVYYNYRGVVTVLLDNGANPNLKDSGGWTPMDWAIYFNYRRITKILASYGGAGYVE